MKIALGSDHGGFKLKEELKIYLKNLNIKYTDFGCTSDAPIDYTDIGFEVAYEVQKGQYDKGILICGTGIGMSIVANKVKGIRAALCQDIFSARLAREHNNANILTLGGRIISGELAVKIVKVWLYTDFSMDERHLNRLNKISKEENKIYK